MARSRLVIPVFFISFFLLSASGRMSSGDALNQLRVALLMLTERAVSPTGEHEAWIREKGEWFQGQNGHFYEPHELGNTVVMLPAALLGLSAPAPHYSTGSTQDVIINPPVAAKIAAALSYAVFSAVGASFIFFLFGRFFSKRAAFFLTVGFVTTTLYWTYSKTALDVMGGSICVCGLLYFCTMIPVSSRPRLNAICASVFFGLTCLFRYALAPFLGLAFVTYLILHRRRLRLIDYTLCALTGFVILLPTFAYNWLRMGNPLRPGTTAPYYLAEFNAMTGNILGGTLGLLFSPNLGLMFHSPVLLLIFLVPLFWKSFPLQIRQLTMCFLPAAIGYVFVIAKMKHWSGLMGVGPRYLLPILPIMAVAIAPIALTLWRSKWRFLLIALVTTSAILAVAPVLVNWQVAVAESPNAMSQDARYPIQQMAMLRGLWLGLHGKPLPTSGLSKAVTEDPVYSSVTRFPDLWLARLAEQSIGMKVLSAVTTLVLVGMNISTLICILVVTRDGEKIRFERFHSEDTGCGVDATKTVLDV